MMTTVEKFQEAVFTNIGIEKVIWIDDFFRDNIEDDQALQEQLYSKIEVLCTADLLDPLQSIGELSEIDFKQPFSIIKSSLPTSPDVVKTILSKLSGSESEDLNKDTFNNFIALFSRYFEFESMSLKTWNSQKDEIVKNDKTLFFVDLDFSKDGGAVDEGKYIVQYLLTHRLDSQYCVLFTHNCLHGAAEETQRYDIIQGFPEEIRHHTFSVLSKSIFGHDDRLGVDFKAPEILKRAFIRKLCSELAHSISDAMKQSIDDINNQLNQHSIYELDGSIFYRSVKEGASEFDVLHRLFSLKQTTALHKLIESKTHIISDLKKLRDIQKIQFKPANVDDREPHKFLKTMFKPGELFLQLRESEIWTSSHTINMIHAPLRCGDTFIIQSEGTPEKHYVLLEQSCDLIVRDNGGRKLNEAVLVPFDLVKITKGVITSPGEYKDEKLDTINSLSKYYTLATPGTSTDTIIFDFSKSFNVNLNLLDLCVFNTDGSATFHSTQKECPDMIFLPGWMERYHSLYARLVIEDSGTAKIRSKDNICGTHLNFTLDAGEDTRVKLSITDCQLSINIRRGDKLNSPFVDSLLRRLYNHKTRLPLEHDFTDISWN
ncbi:hypothetical protein [Aeromonas caviae]|uniref:hypothetical protein n=1 Tax=Aeromonas caviae TaxID=648 RepID=UPI001FFD4D36|nr:hypothetical protein [Aeromonas caviae]MCK2069271.1 hypothetical protein [Aeromonas caviae]